MDDPFGLIIGLLILAILVGSIVLPIIAIVVSVNTRRKLNRAVARFDPASATTQAANETSLSAILQQLTIRVARLETVVQPPAARPFAAEPVTPGPTDRAAATVAPPTPPPPPIRTPPAGAPPVTTALPSTAQAPPPRTIQAANLESVIGRRWLGWAAVALILFAAAFFLKYAFDNRWIGEVGRVAIGVAAGVTFTALGYRYHKRKWRIFSRILTAGGVVLLYLSAYASFGYYHLVTQKAAFAFMMILIAEAAALALLYDAPAIAVMALIGGFLAPVLLRSDRDQYRSLFGYILALDVGTLALLRKWWGLGSLAFAGSHLLFWLWYADNYHPRKLFAVVIFHTALFLAFLCAHLARRLLQPESIETDDFNALLNQPLALITSVENHALVFANAFVYFGTSYFFLNPDHHEWMGVFALAMAVVYAGAAKVLLDRRASTRTELLLMIGVALTFVTLAIPIQLKANWITIAWAIEGLVVLWTGIEMRSLRLRAIAHGLFGLTLLKLFFWDSPYGNRGKFTPVLNKYFLSSLFVAACLFAAAAVYEKFAAEKQIAARIFQVVILVAALITLWWIMTIEAHTYFTARALLEKTSDGYQHERWLGQMTLSVLWSIYAAVLAAVGFLRRAPAIRWAALSLFALTVIKVMLIDIAVLQQLYRIIAFLVLGLILLLVTWGYHRAFYAKQS